MEREVEILFTLAKTQSNTMEQSKSFRLKPPLRTEVPSASSLLASIILGGKSFFIVDITLKVLVPPEAVDAIGRGREISC